VRNKTDLGLGGCGILMQVLAVEEDLTFARPGKRSEDAEQGGLPCAVRTVKKYGVPRVKPEVDSFQGCKVAKKFGDGAELKTCLTAHYVGWHKSQRARGEPSSESPPAEPLVPDAPSNTCSLRSCEPQRVRPDRPGN
jgi:hypothetical protein